MKPDKQQGSLRTNFTKDKKVIYQKAIDLYVEKTGEKRFYILDSAYDSKGRLLDDCFALYDSLRTDTHEFWVILNSLKETNIEGCIKINKTIIDNTTLAYICNDLQNEQDYKVNGKNCYHKDELIGEIEEELKNNILNIYFKPIKPVEFINVNITIKK